jgi:undecaprenyl-diphosphatase
MVSGTEATSGQRSAGGAASKSPSRLRLSIGRHPRDLIRLSVAAVVLTLCSLLVGFPAVNPVEAAIFLEIGTIPDASYWVWQVFDWAGSWPGIVAVGAVALYLKRIRVGLKCLAGGAAAWGIALLISAFLGGRSVPTVQLGLPASLATLTYPAQQVAVAAALVTITGPYLSRTVRALGWLVVVLVAVAEVHLGAHLPLGALAGAVLGWGVGTLFHLVWGAPGRRTSEGVIRRELELAGLRPAAITPVRHQVLGPRQYAVHTEDGQQLRVEVVRRMHRHAGLLYKLRRLLASLEVQDEPNLSTTDHEVEHEAYVTLLAERAGVRTPSVVLACQVKHGSPLLVRKEVCGRRFSTLAEDEVDDALLADVWRQLLSLCRARIAHHDLRAKNFLVDGQGRPWLLNFTFSRAGADEVHRAQDLAEALVSMSCVVGVERAVASAVDTLPAEWLEEALQYVHPLALPHRIRKQVGDRRYQFTALREALATRLDCPVPGFRSPLRPSRVVGLLLVGGAVYLLLPQLSSFGDVVHSLRNANWAWLGGAIVAGLVAVVMSSVSIQGASHVRLPFWRTAAVQLGAAFTGRTTPGGAGFFGINIAYLEHAGIRRSRAVGVTVLNLAGTGLVSGVLCVIGVFGIGFSGVLKKISIPTSWPVLAGIAGGLIILGLVLGSPFGRRKIVHPSLNIARELLSTLHHPVRSLQLFGGALGYQIVSAFGLVASLAAFDPNFPLLAVMTVFVVGQTLGHLAPAPGGLGAVEALMVAGLTAVGIAPTAAVAAVLAMRLLTYWLPVIPGIAMFRYLQHHKVV